MLLVDEAHERSLNTDILLGRCGGGDRMILQVDKTVNRSRRTKVREGLGRERKVSRETGREGEGL